MYISKYSRSMWKYNLCPDIDITKQVNIYKANVKAREENNIKKKSRYN